MRLLVTGGLGFIGSNFILKILNENKDIKIGVCGEHAGEADSINFFNTLGIDYISCSPFRIPTARLAAAQAEITK